MCWLWRRFSSTVKNAHSENFVGVNDKSGPHRQKHGNSGERKYQSQ